MSWGTGWFGSLTNTAKKERVLNERIHREVRAAHGFWPVRHACIYSRGQEELKLK